MEYTSDGLTYWYGTENTPVPPESVTPGSPVSLTVGVHPARLTNSVAVEYCVDGGLKRTLPCQLVEHDHAKGVQFFRGLFPYLPPDSQVEYAPHLTSLGQRIAPRTDELAPSHFRVLPTETAPQEPPSTVAAGPAEARLEDPPPFPYTVDYLARVYATLAPAEMIGPTPEGLRVIFSITGGSIEGERFKAKIKHGGDWLRIRRDGIGIVGVRTTVETEDGAQILMEYSGVLELGEDGFQNTLEGRFPSKMPVHLAPRFQTAAPKYKWLNRLQCLGIGFVTMPDREVRYDRYALRLTGLPSLNSTASKGD